MAVNEAKIILSAEDKTRAAFQSAVGNFEKLGIASGKLSSSLATLFGGLTLGGVVAMGVQISKEIDAFNDLKDTTGASIENISALDRVARETGGSFENVASSLTKFNKVLQGTKADSEEASVFKKLGLDVDSLKQQDPAEALLKTAQAFQKFTIDGDYARNIQILFGKSVQEVAPFLKDLAEKGQLVATTTTQMAEEVEALNKEFYKLSANSTDIKRAFMGDLAIGLNAAFKAFKETRQESNLLVASMTALQAIFQGSEQNQTDKKMVELTDKFLIAQNMLDASKAAGDSPERIKARQDEVNRLREEIRLTQGYRTVLDGVNGAKAPDKKPGMGGVKGKAVSDTAAMSYIDGLNKEIATLGGTSTKTDEVFAHLVTNWDKFTQAQKIEALALADLIDQKKQDIKVNEDQTKSYSALSDALDKSNDIYADLLKSMRDSAAEMEFELSLLGKTAQEVEKLRHERALASKVNSAVNQIAADEMLSQEEKLRRINALYAAAGREAEAFGKIQADALDKQNNAMRGMNDAIQEYLDNLKKHGNDTAQATTRILQSTEDALTQFFTTGKLNARSLIDTIIAEFMRLRVVKPLMASLFGDGGIFGAAASNMGTGGATGIEFDTGSFPMLAGGGPASGGSPYIVGERGPELFIPNSSGTVIPNNKMAGGTVFAPVYNVNIDSRSDAASVYAGVRQMLAQHSRQQRDDLERMGVIAA